MHTRPRGASGARHSPRPHFGEGGKLRANLGQSMPRDRGGVFVVIASEAKQSTLSFLLRYGLLRFARNDVLRASRNPSARNGGPSPATNPLSPAGRRSPD